MGELQKLWVSLWCPFQTRKESSKNRHSPAGEFAGANTTKKVRRILPTLALACCRSADQNTKCLRQGSLHYTPKHCLVNGGFPLFCRHKPCFEWWQNEFLSRRPAERWQNRIRGHSPNQLARARRKGHENKHHPREVCSKAMSVLHWEISMKHLTRAKWLPLSLSTCQGSEISCRGG